MTRLTTLLIALALALPLQAQTTDTTTETPPATEQQTPEGTSSATPDSETETTEDDTTPTGPGGLDLGADPDAPQQVTEPYVKEEFGDWALQCVRTGEEEEPCQLYQLLRDEEGTAVAEVSLFRLPSGGQAIAGATIVVPLETLLTEDLLIGVDGQKGKRYRFSFCNQIGCFARIGLTEADINQFKRGRAATVVIVPFAAPDVQVRLEMSLSGFTAGFDEASVIER